MIPVTDPRARSRFVTQLRQAYRRAPCAVAGFALWKIEAQLPAATLHLFPSKRGQTGLMAINRGKLVLLWGPQPLSAALAADRLRQLRLLNLHGRYDDALPWLQPTHTIHAYRALIFRGRVRQAVRRDATLILREIDTGDDAALAVVARLVAAAGGGATPAQVAGWTAGPAFAPELWLGAYERGRDELLGVGISTFNTDVAEVDLDWFYVHPTAQQRGIGTRLVRETIDRCFDRAQIIRVAGVADRFYERCGFTPCATWYYVARKGSGVQWWE